MNFYFLILTWKKPAGGVFGYCQRIRTADCTAAAAQARLRESFPGAHVRVFEYRDGRLRLEREH